ncbi:MAG: putative ABC transporter permease [Agathobacter sp.]
MWISRYFIYFVIFSFLGWIYETTFCTIKNGKWDNRGFLYGPIVPIYGVGGAALWGVGELMTKNLGGYTWWQIFLIGFFGSIVLEYFTSWALEKLFHAYWWDYSHLPFNIKGRVCLPCSLGFGVAALLIIYVIGPVVTRMVDLIPPIGMELVALLFMAAVAADVTVTISALSNFARSIRAFENAVNSHMDTFVASIQEKTQAAGNLIAEEKERFSGENLERAISAMGGMTHLALLRIQGFKNVKIERKTLENALNAIRKRVPKKNKK